MPAPARTLAATVALLAATTVTLTSPALATPGTPAAPAASATNPPNPFQGVQQGGKDISGISVDGVPDYRSDRPTVVHWNLLDDTTGRPVAGALIVGTLYPDHGPSRVLGRVRTDHRGRFVFTFPRGFKGALRLTWTGDRTHNRAVGRYGQNSSPVGTVGAGVGGGA